MRSALEWIREHDDRLSFVILYVGGAIILSIWLNLFWVAMLMVLHFTIEIARGLILDRRNAVLHAIWEVKLDVALILFALTVALYAEHIFALLGLSQAARAGQAAKGVQFATRFAIIERAFRVFLMTIDDIARLVQVALKLRKQSSTTQPAKGVEQAAPPMPADAAEQITTGDILILAFGAACVALILLMPMLTGVSFSEVIDQIARELSPDA
ncbi:MAG: hypothetical protein ACFCUN_06090 [Hyphomicrobiaceae bacterium]